MLFGRSPIGALGAVKLGLSNGGYIGGGRGATSALSALGPVGILDGKLLGEVWIEEAPPLPLRGPRAADIALGDASLGANGGCGFRGKDGDTFARSTACGADGGTRGFGAGPRGGDFARGEGAKGADGPEGAEKFEEGGGARDCACICLGVGCRAGTLGTTLSGPETSAAGVGLVGGGLKGGRLGGSIRGGPEAAGLFPW